ncbi:MAG TPA: hypothetical protein VFB95_14925 [Candidatus Cryosericum sp.]|nr:hypothetical protein [Candidatus Cryosericum sp.]
MSASDGAASQEGPAAGRFRRSFWLLLLLTLAGLAPLVHAHVFQAGNDASRFAQIEALVDFGEGPIDDTRYRWTVDRVIIGSRVYSNKPPLLSLLGAVVYLGIRTVTGLTFARNEAAVIYLLNLLLAALPTAWLVARFHGTLVSLWSAHGNEGGGPGIARSAALVTAALAAGTILTSFSTVLNNHTIAAACLFAACAAAWSGGALAAGAWIALTACIDQVPGLVFAPALAVMVRDLGGRRGLVRYLGALAAGGLVFVVANLLVTGSPWPPKMVPGASDFSSGMAPSVAGVLLPKDWTYPLAALFGWHGFFSVSPVLLFGAAGMVRAARTGVPLRRLWVVLLGAACAVMIAGHALFVGSYGGWSYGFRYLIPIVPVLLFFAPGVLGAKGRWIFVPILLISCFTALLGAYHPWPPGHEPETGRHPVASVVTNPIGANLAAWMRQHLPGGGPADLAGRLFISADRQERERYLALFYASKGDLAMAQRIVDGGLDP